MTIISYKASKVLACKIVCGLPELYYVTGFKELIRAKVEEIIKAKVEKKCEKM